MEEQYHMKFQTGYTSTCIIHANACINHFIKVVSVIQAPALFMPINPKHLKKTAISRSSISAIPIMFCLRNVLIWLNRFYIRWYLWILRFRCLKDRKKSNWPPGNLSIFTTAAPNQRSQHQCLPATCVNVTKTDVYVFWHCLITSGCNYGHIRAGIYRTDVDAQMQSSVHPLL